MPYDNYKYTNNGKKVVVLGSLNSSESIVQEIFVTQNGAEIPSGESFTVKSLHDEPVESWQTKTIKETKQTYEKCKKEYEIKIRKLKNEKNQEISKLSGLIKNSKLYQSNIENHDFKKMVDFMCGNITHVVFAGYYSEYSIKTFDESLELYDKYDASGLKLITLFGKSNGDMCWKINDYGDGSGFHREIHAFCSEQEAKLFLEQKIKQELIDRPCNEHMIKAKEMYCLSVPEQDLINQFYEDSITAYNKNIDAKQKEIDMAAERINEIKLKIKIKKGNNG